MHIAGIDLGSAKLKLVELASSTGVRHQLLSGELAVDLSTMSDFRDQDCGVFPIKDDAVVPDAIAEDEVGRVDNAFRVNKRVGRSEIRFDLAKHALLDASRQFQKLGFGVPGEGVGNHEKPAFRFTAFAETRPEWREASSEARNFGLLASRFSSSSSKLFLSIWSK